jgi:hypothetical protein
MVHCIKMQRRSQTNATPTGVWGRRQLIQQLEALLKEGGLAGREARGADRVEQYTQGVVLRPWVRQEHLAHACMEAGRHMGAWVGGSAKRRHLLLLEGQQVQQHETTPGTTAAAA